MGSKIANRVMAGVITAAIASTTTQALAAKSNMEKCYGIVAKGKNDCAANQHACAAQAKKDNDPNEWIYVSKGNCKRIAGGSKTPKGGSTKANDSANNKS
jgi:uncharacterized membrane protein